MSVVPFKSLCTLSRCLFSSGYLSNRFFTKREYLKPKSNTFAYLRCSRSSSTLKDTRLATDSNENSVIYTAANYTKGKVKIFNILGNIYYLNQSYELKFYIKSC